MLNIDDRKAELWEDLLKYTEMGGFDACWIWTGPERGSKKGFEYGMVTVGNKGRKPWYRHAAHRLMFRLFYGSFDEKMCVLHKCDNTKCVNPKHLFLGDRAENMRDKIRKGRQLRGEQFSFAKLTEEDVRFIRQDTILSQRELAEVYGVDQSEISNIKRGKAWKHVK